MGTIKTFRDLIFWQKSMDLVTQIYRASGNFPKVEFYGLISQMRRSAVSIPSNIAEGYGRRSTGDYIRHLQISVGSLYELQTQLEISKNLGFISELEFDNQYDTTREIERMLLSLVSKIKSSSSN